MQQGMMLMHGVTPDVLCAGLRMRHPQSLVAGMMWFDPDRPDILSNVRHLALERDGTAIFQIASPPVCAICIPSHLAHQYCIG